MNRLHRTAARTSPKVTLLQLNVSSCLLVSLSLGICLCIISIFYVSRNDMFQDLLRVQDEFDANTVSSGMARKSKAVHWRPFANLHELEQYECVQFHYTANCSPTGVSIQKLKCSVPIPGTASGYCEVRHRITGEIRSVLNRRCGATRTSVEIACNQFRKVLGHALRAKEFEPNPSATAATGRKLLHMENPKLELATSTFDRGIAMIISPNRIHSAYASIKWLRQTGCILPIELWYRPTEFPFINSMKAESNASYPVIAVLIQYYDVFLRKIDPNAQAESSFAKIYAVAYSTFKQLLLLDADNFAVSDPTRLFESDAFVKTGAIFWPDFWLPDRTMFFMNDHSLVWEMLNVEYVYMFEQESGQVLIDRERHTKALSVLAYFGLRRPRLLVELGFSWGDKDLFRFAWMTTNSTFHFISGPPGSAGILLREKNLFCGQSIVQHDPDGKIIFVHRNNQKLRPNTTKAVWTHIQEYNTADLSKFRVDSTDGDENFSKWNVSQCFGKYTDYGRYYKLTAFEDYPFAHIEATLFEYVKRSGAMIAPFPELQPEED
uniref:Uncharacterized protein AlNc14C85G5452 n=1 Tax=Albugo laibachii Nc14 TaxID=890382 RepID=F0WFR7_9STRA|nr:conserved hypothetical protein [Albugo laibachii Nc14]|eukprot:CCA20051.1 conserved hypothetical protein [Albugo laibachii Nc14]